MLGDLHRLPCAGFGPLVGTAGDLRGETATALGGVRARWHWAPCWPFGGTDLAAHPLSRSIPGAVSDVERWRARILEAAEGPTGVVHSDLHREHLLIGPDGALTGVLDFGDAFVGAIAWDLALLHWYYGAEESRAVASRHPLGVGLAESAKALALAVGLYKLAKAPSYGPD